MINFYKNNGVGTIQFASGQVVSLSDDVSVRADNTVNQIIISEFNRDKFWININQTLQVEGVTITGTNQQKVDLIAPVFAEAAQSGGGGIPTSIVIKDSFSDHTITILTSDNLTSDLEFRLPNSSGTAALLNDIPAQTEQNTLTTDEIQFLRDLKASYNS